MKYIIGFLILLLLFVVGCSTSESSVEIPEPSNFVQCLAEKNVTFYGAYWCSHCADQKRMLGNVEPIYVECDPRGDNEQAERCLAVGVEAYPSFDFGDGELVTGVQTFAELSEISGCSLG